MNIDKKNSEGYIDMTSYEALTNIRREEMVLCQDFGLHKYEKFN